MSKSWIKKTADAESLTLLADQLAGSEFNSILLELFRKRASAVSAGDLLENFSKNRFCSPSPVDAIGIRELEIEWLKFARDQQFKVVNLSPLTALGTTSAVAPVHQNNIVSALRGTEIVADATNVLALIIAEEARRKRNGPTLQYATTHRHVRAQAFSNPAFSSHFALFCMATGGMDRGSFSFETEQFLNHLRIHLSMLAKEFEKGRLLVKIFLKEKNEAFHNQIRQGLKSLNKKLAFDTEDGIDQGDYYKTIRFKIFLHHEGESINLSDGGLVDWTQQLIPNKKHRLFISGSGLEIIYKIIHNQL